MRYLWSRTQSSVHEVRSGLPNAFLQGVNTWADLPIGIQAVFWSAKAEEGRGVPCPALTIILDCEETEPIFGGCLGACTYHTEKSRGKKGARKRFDYSAFLSITSTLCCVEVLALSLWTKKTENESRRPIIMVKSSWDDADWIWNYELLLYLKAIINIVGSYDAPPRETMLVWIGGRCVLCAADSGDGKKWHRPNTFDHDCRCEPTFPPALPTPEKQAAWVHLYV